MITATCGGCGAPLSSEQRFCTGCGAQTHGDPVAAPQPFLNGGIGVACGHCGGDGRLLAGTDVYCPSCRWLRPLAPDYRVPVEAFMWSFDAQAMSTLQRVTPLRAAAAALSHKVGRPWLEASVNGIRLGPDQLPDIFDAAIVAARALSLPRLPELYLSGEQMWDCMTLGSEQQQFIVVGSVLANLRGTDLVYLLGREMGHVAAGHALWKTVMQFISGRQAGNRTIMGHGVFQFLSINKLVESAVDAPLMAWARHAEITADRAGALAAGDRAAAWRVATQWTLKSFPLYARLNLETLQRDVAASDDRQMQLSEWTMSSTPYLARRLRLLDDYFDSETLKGWRAVIDHWTRPEAPPEVPDPEAVRISCVVCGTGMKLRRADLEGKESAKVRCTNAACGKVLEISPRPPDQAQVHRVVTPPPEGLRVTCPACQGELIAPADALTERETVNIRCPDQRCGKVLTLRRPAPPPPPVDQLAQADEAA